MPIPDSVKQVVQTLQEIQSKALPPDAKTRPDLIATAEILGQEAALRRPLDVDGPGAAIVLLWKTAATAGRRVMIFQGNGQIGKISKELPVPLAVRITDSFGHPPSSVVQVKFVVKDGGAIKTPESQTDKDGIAFAGHWTLGNKTGLQTVVAKVGDSQVAAFSAVAI